MLVDIDRIVVREGRIRKDFGDIQELADNIKKNGLLNPLTVNQRYELLAGERRLRACIMLGWNQVDVRMVSSEDEAQDLDIEMSENNMRRNFTGSELADGLRRQMAIESEKAKKRRGERTDIVQAFAEGGTGRARDIVGDAFGISGEQVRKTLFVDDNRDLLNPSDFADWDEGKLSTNKAYQRIKAAQKQAEEDRLRAEDALRNAERQRILAERERDAAHEALEDAYQTNEMLEDENARLRNQPKPEPQVIEKEVVREVKPDDYEETKRRNESLARENKRLLNENGALRDSNLEKDRQIEERDRQIGERQRNNGANRDVEQLVNNVYTFLNRHGGKSRAFDQFYRVDETMQLECRKALVALDGFAQSLLAMIDETNRLGE